VQDAGIGFKPEERDRLFEAFYTTKTARMGMGLAISRSIIEAHAGVCGPRQTTAPGLRSLISLPAAPEQHALAGLPPMITNHDTTEQLC